MRATTPRTGRLRVETATSCYILDFDEGTVTRMPGTMKPVPGAIRPELRQDTEPVPLLGFVEPVVGQPMLLALNLEDGVFTRRLTTPVRRIDVMGRR